MSLALAMLILPFCNIYFFINGANVTERWMWRSYKNHLCLNGEGSAAVCARAEHAWSWWKTKHNLLSIWGIWSLHQSRMPHVLFFAIRTPWIHMVWIFIYSFIHSTLSFFTKVRVACVFLAIYQCCPLFAMQKSAAFPYMKFYVSFHPCLVLIALPSFLTSFP